jgi:hypothetical protein
MQNQDPDRDKKDHVRFSDVSLDDLTDAQMEEIFTKTISEKRDVVRSLMKSLMRSALRSAQRTRSS